MKLNISLLFFLVSFASFSQNDPQIQQSLLDLGSLNNTSTNVVVLLSADENFEVTGSPFFIKEFTIGSVQVSEKSSPISDVQLRYNVYLKTLEAIQKDINIKLINENVYSFKIENQGSLFHFINSNALGTNREFEAPFLRIVAKNENIMLIKELTKSRLVRDSTEPYSASKNEIVYTDNEKYYFLNKDEVFLISNKKNLIDKFPVLGMGKKLNGLSVKKEEDLISILKML